VLCPRSLRMNNALLRDYMLRLVGTPYRWGGNCPLGGLDCSGLVLEILRSIGIWPHGVDTTAQGIHDRFRAAGTSYAPGNTIPLGTLAFYGKSPKEITHIAICFDETHMLEAGGGDSKTVTAEDADRQNAWVRIRPIYSRRDLVALIHPAR
jgi:cell wall-associated NlpC family hydrolase